MITRERLQEVLGQFQAKTPGLAFEVSGCSTCNGEELDPPCEGCEGDAYLARVALPEMIIVGIEDVLSTSTLHNLFHLYNEAFGPLDVNKVPVDALKTHVAFFSMQALMRMGGAITAEEFDAAMKEVEESTRAQEGYVALWAALLGKTCEETLEGAKKAADRCANLLTPRDAYKRVAPMVMDRMAMTRVMLQ